LLINLVKSRRMKCKRDHNRDKSTTYTKFSSGNPKACDDLWDMHSQFCTYIILIWNIYD